MNSNDSCIPRKVDVIIPAHQAADFIRRAMDSVRLQGEWVHNVFIVDNASTDNTSEVVRGYIEEYELTNWRLLHEPRKGAPAARNHPLHEVTAEWVQFLDADDELLAGKIEHQLSVARTQTCDVVVGASCHMNESGETTIKQPEEEVRLALISSRCGITSTNLFRTCSVRAVHGWNESLSSSQEYELMFRLWQVGAKFSMTVKPLTRIHERRTGRISTSNLPKKWNNHCEVQRRMLQAFAEDDSNSSEINRWLQAHFSCIRILYQFNREEATRFWRVAEFGGFIPDVNSGNTWGYVLLFRLLGFEATERLRRAFKKLTFLLSPYVRNSR